MNILIIRETDNYRAQVLEFDIGTTANSVDKLVEDIEAKIYNVTKDTFLTHGLTFHEIEPASDTYWKMWENVERRVIEYTHSYGYIGVEE